MILVTGDTVEWQLGRALGAAADVASWDRERLLSVNPELEVVDGAESPALVLVAGGYDPRALATIDWLASRHDVPVSAYTVAMVRFGGERLLVRPPRAGRRAAPRATTSTGCSRAAPPRHRARARGRAAAYTDSAAASALAEEQAEDAPELVGAPVQRRPAAHPHDVAARVQPCASSACDRGAVGLGHREPHARLEHRAQQRRRRRPGRAPGSAAPATAAAARPRDRSGVATAPARPTSTASARSSPVTRASSASTASRSAGGQRAQLARRTGPRRGRPEHAVALSASKPSRS